MSNLQLSQTNSQTKQMVNMASINTKRLLRMVDQLLDLARLDNTETDQQTSVNISQVCHFILTSLQSLFDSKNMQLTIDIEANLWVGISNDAAEKILVNLLSNAVKYTQDNGQIEFSCRQVVDKVKVTVKDNGYGIKPAQQQKVFERFVRVEDEHIQTIPGAGIGLALVKELVERFAGIIELNSELNCGSSFVVTFALQAPVNEPAKQNAQNSNSQFVVEQELNLFKQSVPAIPAPVAADEQATSNRPQLLIVEDHQDMQRYITQQLHNDYDCHLANDGVQGTQMAIDIIPDLIITDLMMPKLNGLDMARLLRNDMATSHIPIIMLTAKGDDQSRIAAWKTDIDEYMAKPFDQQALSVRIQSLLNIRKLMSARLALSPVQESTPKQSTADKQQATETRLEGISERDKAFLQQLELFIANNFYDSQCKGKQLYSDLAMTERQFHRKIKAILNQTFSDLLRTYRLQQGADMLKTEKGITEIAFDCGFSSQNYFSQCFKAQFGVSPSQYKSSNN